MRKVRRKIRWTRVFLTIITLLVVMSAVIGSGMYIYTSKFTPLQSLHAMTSSITQFDLSNKRINILILGLDDGDNETVGSARRSDTLMVANINPDDGTIKLLSLPRDTKVTIPGRKDYDKLMHAFFYGGPTLATKTVADFLHIPLDYYVVIDWQAFIKCIDLIGGVDLYVERNMDYDDPYANLSIHLTQGYQHLDGQKAGEYVRFRHDELGDIGRVQRQQRFFKALTTEVFQVSTLFKIPSLVKLTIQSIQTDINFNATIKLANALRKFRSTKLQTEMIPGSFSTIDGLNYWIPDDEPTRSLLERIFIK